MAKIKRAKINLLIYFILFYRWLISPILGNNCRFHPTCSAYAIDAFREKGIIKGFFLIIWRLIRCQPFCKGGYDPVVNKNLK